MEIRWFVSGMAHLEVMRRDSRRGRVLILKESATRFCGGKPVEKGRMSRTEADREVQDQLESKTEYKEKGLGESKAEN